MNKCISGRLKVLPALCYFACLFILPSLFAQNPVPVNTYTISAWWGPPPPPFSPVVEPGGNITFRTKAPKAAAVDLLFGEWDIRPQPMAKDTAGVWTITIHNIPPGIYSYVFSVDGVQLPDMNNPVTKTGTQIYSSMVEVPGTPPRFDELQPVPHGVLENLTYTSTALHRSRGLTVFLPPQYASKPQSSFPVLYLRHGGGDNETSWTQSAGKADIILDNLLAKNKAVPMIIVMTNGLTDGTWAGGSTPEAMLLLEKELMTDVKPMVEKMYRVRKGPASTAIAGLSMGGGQSFVMGLRNTDAFAWIGDFSAGLLSDKNLDVDKLLPGMVNSRLLNAKLKLLWIGCGTDDPRYNGHLVLNDLLEKRGIRHEFHSSKGGHEWRVWREQLAGFMEKLFK